MIAIKGRTPLLLASEKGHTGVVQELLKAGANVGDTDMEGNTPLHFASEKGVNDMVQILLKFGAKTCAKNKEENTPLHCASKKGNYLVVHELFQSFADVFAKNKDGQNALDIAIGGAEQYLLALKEKDFPREIFTLGPQAVLEFVKARQKGSYRSNIIRCMVVGHFGVGKTTLVRKLMNKIAYDVSSTNGIEVHIGKCYFDKVTRTWITKEHTKHPELILGLENIVQIHFWDFGGQLIFYTTHQSYLSRRGLYLLVFDLSIGLQGEVQDQDLDPVSMTKKKVIDYLEFWIGSIRLYGKSTNDGFPKIVLIGTHIDKVQETQQAPDCPTECPGPADEFGTTLDDKLLMRISRKCGAEYLMPLSANLVGNVQFYGDKREEFRELSPKDCAFLIFQEWKCILLRKHKDVTVERLVKLLSDSDVDVHIICQALRNKGEDDSFLSPIVRQMEVYDEFIDAVADQMSATYLQIGIELGFNLGEIKQMRVSHQCSAPKIVREMLRIWLKRNASRDNTLIGSLASALLHAQENIAVLMDIEGKAVIQHLSRKRQESRRCNVL